MNDDALYRRPGLLVSVRNVEEALAALAGGADVIDVKEPDRGSLGAADASIISAVVRAVSGRATVTAAAGELVDILSDEPSLPDGVAFFKIGLAECRDNPDWPKRWRGTADTLSRGGAARPVAVMYADFVGANSPDPDDVLAAAVERGCPALLIDTWDKSAGSLFSHWPPTKLSIFVREAQLRGLAVVLAGSLMGESIIAAARLRPDLVAVRTAACDAGRCGNVSSNRVRTLKQTILAASASW